MKLHKIVILVLVTVIGGQLFALDKGAELQAIAFKEKSPAGRVGKRGELGIYQMLPVNVQKYGGYETANALLMLNDIIAELQNAGIDPNSFNCGLAWNAGTGAVIRGQAPTVSYQYAVKVRQYYETIILAKSSKDVLK